LDVPLGAVKEFGLAPVLEVTETQVARRTEEAAHDASVMAVIYYGGALRHMLQANSTTPSLLSEECIEGVAGKGVPSFELLPARDLSSTLFAT
jgi:hypothetical protein